MKLVLRRAASDQDVESIIDHYLAQAGSDVALAFVDALEAAAAHLARQPATGSPRLGQDLGLPGMRTWPLRTFPYLVCYFEHEDFVEVWRVLHAGRDIPVHLLGPGQS